MPDDARAERRLLVLGRMDSLLYERYCFCAAACWAQHRMNKAQIEEDIALLESRLAEAKAAKPAHDISGAHQATLLEIEDELAEKREALAALSDGEGPE